MDWMEFGFICILGVCAWFDWKDRSVPVWGLFLLWISNIGMCVAHPFLSIITGGLTILVILFLKMGAADKLAFGAISMAFPLYGVIVVLATLLLSIWHARKWGEAPGVTYIFVILLIGEVVWG